MKNTTEALAVFPIRHAIEVQWRDMDAAQHVNNVIYLSWAESSRVAYFYGLGNEVISKINHIGFILAWQDCKYIFPVTFPDSIHMGVKATEIGTDRFTLETHMYSERHDRIVAISKQIVVTYDYKKLEKIDLPDFIKDNIEQLESTKY
ncbi:MAG: acyl-CoA thioesterase [Saprospiraceae bacterium]